MTDIAATLTFYSVLSVLPGMLGVFGMLGLIGRGQQTADVALDIAGKVAPQSTVDQFRHPIEQFAHGGGAGVGVVVGMAAALWTASRYVAAFSGGLNRIYRAQEGRRYPKLRLVQLAITAAVLVLVAVVVFVVLLSGPLLAPASGALSLGRGGMLVWNVVRWPVVAGAAVLIIVLLYWGTPNVRQPRLQWLSVGGVSAMVLMAGASALFGFYVTHFPAFHREYGSLAGLVAFLVWLWLMNLVLVFGAGFDVELERARELQSGTDATRAIRLPLRDERRLAWLRRTEDALIRDGEALIPKGRDGSD
ncbi:YihY/virulence factor BrkB family protein [Gryllotalpicola ginsengisoli]|uniref:YihY/virulence factor BrkB family protein n=1 Tax=Gryllotalpicola ginsengisoli TaxID=444608 RepID=UPI0003B54936|nr:YihY/virulence factor BrkB family protein [Gryllotalpicola ginsengisoli]